jgi:hypothetical protein
MAKITRTAVVDENTEDSYEENTQESYDETPARPSVTRKVSKGWGSAGETEERRETVKAPYIDFGKQSGDKIVKILDDEPVARWRRHFIPGRPPIYCHGGNCPLCAKNYKAAEVYRINVVEMSDPNSATEDGWTVKVWDFTFPVARALQGYMEKMDLNDPRRYFQLMYVRGNGVTVVPLNRSMVEEEFGIIPMTDSEIEEAQTRCYGEETVFINTPSKVAEIAEGLSYNKDTK